MSTTKEPIFILYVIRSVGVVAEIFQICMLHMCYICAKYVPLCDVCSTYVAYMFEISATTLHYSITYMINIRFFVVEGYNRDVRVHNLP